MNAYYAKSKTWSNLMIKSNKNNVADTILNEIGRLEIEMIAAAAFDHTIEQESLNI